MFDLSHRKSDRLKLMIFITLVAGGVLLGFAFGTSISNDQLIADQHALRNLNEAMNNLFLADASLKAEDDQLKDANAQLLDADAKLKRACNGSDF